MYISLSLSLSLYMYIYIYTHYMYVVLYAYIGSAAGPRRAEDGTPVLRGSSRG